MLTEFKRDNTATELDEIQNDIAKRKKRLRDLDEQIKDHNDRMREFEDIGMNPEEVCCHVLILIFNTLVLLIVWGEIS
jgi:hypothetical protein